MNTSRIVHVQSHPPDGGDGTPLNPLPLREALGIAASEKGRTLLYLHEGVYGWPWPLRFGPEMSHVEFRAVPGGNVIFDGGVAIPNWRETPFEYGDPGQTVWTADVSRLVSSHGAFKFLSVNGEPRVRCRFPASGQLGAQKSESRLTCALPPKIVRAREAEDWELVLFYDWVCRRLKVTGVDSEGIDFVPDMTKRGRDATFHLENLPLEFLEPGQWKLDSNLLFYRPMEGESPDSLKATAACAPSLLEIHGDPASGSYVEGLVFDGVEFRHTGDGALVNSNQADWACSAAVSLSGALECRFENCAFTSTSGWGLEFGEGCRNNTVAGCRFENLGAGGIKANGSTEPESPAVTGGNRFVGNTMRHGGLTWGGAVGILLRHTGGNEVSGNEIAWFRYSGISCGWVWGYGPNISRDNLIANNHIHHLGLDHLLVDLGGIYTLGVQPGTVIRGNILHDICGKTISWGIYLDEGSSGILVEENLVYRVASECFHLHYGRHNLARNNVFALGNDGLCSITRGTMDIQCRFTPGDKAVAFENNIMVSSGSPFYVKYLLDYEVKEDLHCLDADHNLLHSLATETPAVGSDGYHCHEHTYAETFAFEEWQRNGFDRHSSLLGPKQTAIPLALLEKQASPAAREMYRRFLEAVKSVE